MLKCKKLVLLPVFALTLSGCASEPEDPQFVASKSLQPYMQEDYQTYLAETQEWLLENRVFFTDDKQIELSAVAPFELVPQNPNGQGILLVHGLGDSPFSYVDIAPDLAAQGYLVRVILLPGHGTRAADLSLPELEDWQNVVAHHYQLLNAKVDGVWLGGFSTGANLVTALAYQQPTVKGLLLFSPAFKPRNSLAKYSPYAKWFVDWEGKTKEDNYTRYNSLHMNGAATYYETSAVVRDYLDDASYDKPTFVMLSEADETIDSQYAMEQFSKRFTNSQSELLWFGETQYKDDRITSYSMDLPQQKILSASHISLVFSPDNPIYKRDGEVRLCFREQPEGMPEDCSEVASDQVWFAAFGDGEETQVRARISWNPYFDQSMQKLNHFLADNNN
ncbi:alpha/beta hydrolase [Vibrio breoganii]|uniref:alpha/beta hydrolase n=1 Tax=Vibrio breoganii TaxID=553239 RepID=UPI000C84C982|nr:alpha/beta fold hydrolase [Vibrio breoganii]PMH17708.1 esterase [Vibrio breoganii]PMM13927.1 esterase [Vibrio breoganii]